MHGDRARCHTRRHGYRPGGERQFRYGSSDFRKSAKARCAIGDAGDCCRARIRHCPKDVARRRRGDQSIRCLSLDSGDDELVTRLISCRRRKCDRDRRSRYGDGRRRDVRRCNSSGCVLELPPGRCGENEGLSRRVRREVTVGIRCNGDTAKRRECATRRTRRICCIVGGKVRSTSGCCDSDVRPNRCRNEQDRGNRNRTKENEGTTIGHVSPVRHQLLLFRTRADANPAMVAWALLIIHGNSGRNLYRTVYAARTDRCGDRTTSMLESLNFYC